jgi:mannosyltransferase OCH1-like enzyme
MFSKVIWQTHELPYEKLPTFQKDIIKTWKDLNPDWEHRYVDAEERSKQVKEYDDLLYNFYLLVGKIDQADIWRLVVIYKNGGVYADMDSICLKSITEAISWNYKGEDMMCSSIGFQSYGINNSNFGAKKNNEIIKLMIDSLILKYSTYSLEKLSHLGVEVPANYLFSKIAQENKKYIYFNNEYFDHTEKYKRNFNINQIKFK